MLYFIIVFVAFFVIFYAVIYPIMKKNHVAKTQNFELENTGKEEVFKNELFATYFSFIPSQVEGEPEALSQCENHRSIGDKTKEIAASAARSIVQRSLGGPSRDMNKKVYQSYLTFTDSHFYYLEFDQDDDFRVSKKMDFEIAKMKEIKQSPNTMKYTTKLSFKYDEQEYRFEFYSTGISSVAGYGKAAQELSQKVSFALVKPFVARVNKLTA